MRVVCEEIDGSYYMDVIFSNCELDRLRLGEMINCSTQVSGKKFYVGSLKNGDYNYEEKNIWQEEDFESDEGI